MDERGASNSHGSAYNGGNSYANGATDGGILNKLRGWELGEVPQMDRHYTAQ